MKPFILLLWVFAATSALAASNETKKSTKPDSKKTSESSSKKSTSSQTSNTSSKKSTSDKSVSSTKKSTTSETSDSAVKKSDSSTGANSSSKKSTSLESSEDTPKKSTSSETSDSSAKKSPSSETSDKEPEIAEGPAKKPDKRVAAVSTMKAEELKDFETYPAPLQEVIKKSLALTELNLSYQFGSADPKAGGMDCSGTIYRVLMDQNIKNVPRQSDEICRWVMRQSILYRTENTHNTKDVSLSALKPGDLLFWTGTYETSAPRKLPITHVMMYLGQRKKDGKHVVFGASDGRSYDGMRRNGVSLFDLSMPKADSKSEFYGYGPIPGLVNSALN